MSSRRDCSEELLAVVNRRANSVHTDTQVGIDAGVSGSASQVLVLPVRDVEMGLRVTVLLGKTKVNHVDLVAALADAHKEVVRLDIAVDE
jgi:hypothetical protein